MKAMMRIHCGSPGHPDDFLAITRSLNLDNTHIINRLEDFDQAPSSIYCLGWSYGAHFALQDLMEDKAQIALLICPWFVQSDASALGIIKKGLINLLGSKLLKKHCQKQMPLHPELWADAAKRWSGQRLIHALEEKRSSQALLDFWEQNTHRVHCLYGLQDPLLHQLSPQAQRLIRMGHAVDGPHGLPLTDPVQCSQWIHSCLHPKAPIPHPLPTLRFL